MPALLLMISRRSMWDRDISNGIMHRGTYCCKRQQHEIDIDQYRNKYTRAAEDEKDSTGAEADTYNIHRTLLVSSTCRLTYPEAPTSSSAATW